LNDGRILMVGDGAATDIYDPSTGLFASSGRLSVPRMNAAAVLLDDGTVLVAGGDRIDPTGQQFEPLSSAELFHPDTGTFELLPSSMSTPRRNHTLTKLADGRVLVAGGSATNSGDSLDSAEIYTPGSRTFGLAGPMHATHQSHTATLLPNNLVLIAGGWGNPFARADLFDPATNTFTAVAQPMRPHALHSATLMPDGRVILIGGGGDNGSAVNYADFFDWRTNAFTPAGTMTAYRLMHTATLLSDGSVLVAGGLSDNNCCYTHAPQASLERFVPGAGFVGAGSMLAARYQHTATRLANGKILLAGTWGWSNFAGHSAELFDRPTAPAILNPSL